LVFDAQTFTQLLLQPSSADLLLKPHPLIYSQPQPCVDVQTELCGCRHFSSLKVRS